MKWLRLYDELLDDPKVQRLNPALFRDYINLLCLANRQRVRGTLPPVPDLAFAIRTGEETAASAVAMLVIAGLIDDIDGGYQIHGWDDAQTGRLAAREWQAIRAQIFERDDYTCRYCGVKGGRLECDHVVPLSRGGSNEPDNLTAACFDCNRSKRDHLLEEWQV